MTERDDATIRVLFNPSCSKCRQTKTLLEERSDVGDVNYVHYLEEHPTRADLESIVQMLGLTSPRGMMRTNELVYTELNLASADDDSRLFDAMIEHPILIERPIVIRGTRAVIARPPEKVFSLFDE